MAYVGYPIEIGSPEDLARHAGRLRNPIDRQLVEPLSKEALENARALRRKHRTAWEQDPEEFRKIKKRAESKVLRLKPGPKEDPNVVAAAEEYVELWPDFTWESLCRKHDPLHAKAHPDTLHCVVDSFQRKGKRYVRDHAHLQHKLDQKWAVPARRQI